MGMALTQESPSPKPIRIRSSPTFICSLFKAGEKRLFFTGVLANTLESVILVSHKTRLKPSVPSFAETLFFFFNIWQDPVSVRTALLKMSSNQGSE